MPYEVFVAFPENLCFDHLQKCGLHQYLHCAIRLEIDDT